MTRQCWTLVTGQPGCGKTTAVMHFVAALQEAGIPHRGFYTEEVLSKSGSRVGFDVVTVPDGRRGVLSRKDGDRRWPKTGKYSVDVAGFEALARPSLEPSDNSVEIGRIVYVVDEIGRMELHSTWFRQRTGQLLEIGAPLVGAVTAPIYGHRVPFCDQVTAHEGVDTHKLTKNTRAATVAKVIETFSERYAPVALDGPPPTKRLRKGK